MELINRVNLTLSRLFPKSYKSNFSQILIYGGIKKPSYQILGSSVIYCFIVFTIINLIPLAIFQKYDFLYLGIAVGSILFIQIMIYMYYFFKMEDRTAVVEESLPDLLQLVAANLRAGMTPFQALKHAARDEFGCLKDEILYASSRSLGSESFSKSLMNISKRINSEMLERAMKLFTTAMKSGGQLAQLLEELSRDIAETKSLKRELVTNTKTYSMFIMFTVTVGTPILLSIAIQFVKMITGLQVKTGGSSNDFGMSFLAGEVVVSVEFLTWLSIGMLICTSILSSMLAGVISEGKAKYGLRFAPAVIAGSLIAFLIAGNMIGNMMGTVG